jgi:hypothetical protein
MGPRWQVVVGWAGVHAVTGLFVRKVARHGAAQQ